MGIPDMNNQKRKKLYQTKQGLPSWLPDYMWRGEVFAISDCLVYVMFAMFSKHSLVDIGSQCERVPGNGLLLIESIDVY